MKKGDRPRAPVELIVRRVKKSGEIFEEKVLLIGYDEPIGLKEIKSKLNTVAKKLLSDDRKKKRSRG